MAKENIIMTSFAIIIVHESIIMANETIIMANETLIRPKKAVFMAENSKMTAFSPYRCTIYT
jgi:hypothetical protein